MRFRDIGLHALFVAISVCIDRAVISSSSTLSLTRLAFSMILWMVFFPSVAYVCHAATTWSVLVKKKRIHLIHPAALSAWCVMCSQTYHCWQENPNALAQILTNSAISMEFGPLLVAHVALFGSMYFAFMLMHEVHTLPLLDRRERRRIGRASLARALAQPGVRVTPYSETSREAIKQRLVTDYPELTPSDIADADAEAAMLSGSRHLPPRSLPPSHPPSYHDAHHHSAGGRSREIVKMH